jgi:hypothetical protein
LPDAAEDKKQIGLTDGGNEALSQLMNAGLFDSEYDGYKVSIAYSLAKGVDPAAAAGSGYHTKFNAAGGLDLDNQIRDLISVLLPAYADRPYATAERLAEAGIRQLAARIEAKESLADILEELGSGRDRGASTTLAPIDGDREQNSDHAT